MVVQTFCVRVWAGHLGFREDVPGAPLPVGKADREQACIVPVRAAMGPAWLTGGVSARGWTVSNSSSVVRLE